MTVNNKSMQRARSIFRGYLACFPTVLILSYLLISCEEDTFDALEGEDIQNGNENHQTSDEDSIESKSATLFFDDFETPRGWARYAAGSNPAELGLWGRAVPQATVYNGQQIQLGTAASGVYNLVTDGRAGFRVNSYDVDGGSTSIRSPEILLSGQGDFELSLKYYFNYVNANSYDFFRIEIQQINPLNGSVVATQEMFNLTGQNGKQVTFWQFLKFNLNAFAGKTIRILITANDGYDLYVESLVEAGIDDVRVELTSSITCDTPTGLSASNVTETGANLSWDAVAGSDGYVLQHRASTSSFWETITDLTNTSYQLNGLTPGVEYEVRVGTICGQNQSDYSPPLLFTTGLNDAKYHLDMIAFRDLRGCAVGRPCYAFFDDFEIDLGWTFNPDQTDTATYGKWERAVPQCTSYQNCDPISGSYTLVTGPLAGYRPYSHDIDNGVTTAMSSRAIPLPVAEEIKLHMHYYFSHSYDATADDFLKIEVLANGNSRTILTKEGRGVTQAPDWTVLEADLSEFSGQNIQIRISAADGGRPTYVVEAGIDDIMITSSVDRCVNFYDDNKIPQVQFSKENLEILEPSNPRVASAEHVHCFQFTLTDREVNEIRAEIEEMRANTSLWSGGELELEIDFHDVTEPVEMKMAVWGYEPFPDPEVSRDRLLPYLGPETDFVVVSHNTLDRTTGYHVLGEYCGGTYGADLANLVGAGFTWVPYRGSIPNLFNCAEDGTYMHEWMHQLFSAVHDVSLFDDCFGNPFPHDIADYPNCNEHQTQCKPQEWFPDTHHCHLDPDAPYCGQPENECGENNTVHRHILEAHWPLLQDDQPVTIIANHCRNGIQDFGEESIDQGGPCL
ncbi:MAG: fibronectin type III domain-containing protein [Myxococcota bacterium]|nr:fibronectin type III domain-containing protein [Myxococcota bacterium]